MTAPEMYRLIGPRTSTAIIPFQCGAPWTGHAGDDELLRLDLLNSRIQRRKSAIAELEKEQRRIMNRCIRRMRRSKGKN